MSVMNMNKKFIQQDDRIPWEHAYQCYQELSRWGSNRNVHFVTTELPAVVGGIMQLADMGLGMDCLLC